MAIKTIITNPVRPVEILVKDHMGRRQILQFSQPEEVIASIKAGDITQYDTILRVIDDKYVVYSRLQAESKFCSIPDLLNYFG